MIRQAHTYLVGALSGVVVIGIAIAAFVVLVSAQVFHDLPIPALSSSDQNAAAVSGARALPAPDRQVAAAGGVTTGTAQPNRAIANANANAVTGKRAGATNSRQPTPNQANTATPTRDATGPAEVVVTPPSNSLGTVEEGPSSSGGNSGGSQKPSQPASKAQQPTSSQNPGSVGGGNPKSSSGTSGTSNGGSGNTTPTTTTTPGAGAPSTGTSGGGSTTTAPPPTPVTTAKPSEAVTESVNNAVGTVDEVTGGALTETGVKGVTEEVVNGVAGPESVVGKTVDGVGEVVGGLVGGNGQ